MPERPLISIIVPVYNGGLKFQRSLAALIASSYSPIEIIVVDDASTDGAVKVAAHPEEVRVLRLAERSGPAAARNCGAREAAGPILFFVDADVLVKPDTVERVAAAFQAHPGISAVFGSYDDAPEEKNFLSQYKNLFHHFTHQQSDCEAETFWAGCGAIRREVFQSLGGFDQNRYERSSIEDIELGYRMSEKGYRILLDKELQVKHLKRWRLGSLLEADILRRAVPWSRLILERGRLVNHLNLKINERMSAALTGLSVAALLLGTIRPQALYLALSLWILVVIINHKLYRFFLRRKGVSFTLLVPFIHLLYYLYSGASFILCWVRHVIQRRQVASKRRDAEAL